MRIWIGGVRKCDSCIRVAFAVVFACLIGIRFAEACSCNPNERGVRDAVANADVVFRGTITDIRDAKRDVLTDILQSPKRIVVFRVTRVWKGKVGATFEMPAIENPGGICRGFPPDVLVVGNELLVYAYEHNSEYLTGVCSRTRLAKQSKADFDELGEGTPPAAELNAAEHCEGSEAGREFLREKNGLHKAALANNGRFVSCTSFNEGWIDYQTVPQLLADSDLVAVGIIGGLAEQLNGLGNNIETEAEFKLERVLASKRATAPSVKVKIPGGSVIFADGTSATVTLYNYPRFTSGARYILFLHLLQPGFYVPLPGPKGIFKIVNKKVMPQADPSSALATRYRDVSAPSFEEEVVAAAEQMLMPVDRLDSYRIYSSLMEVVGRNSPPERWLVSDTTVTAVPDREPCKLDPAGSANPANLDKLLELRSSMNPHVAVQPPENRRQDFAEILQDFDRHCHDRITLDTNAWRLPVPVVLMTSEEQAKYKSAVFAGKPADQKYRGARGIDAFSLVYFNANRTVALVYSTHYCGSLCGEGVWVALALESGEWKQLHWNTRAWSN